MRVLSEDDAIGHVHLAHHAEGVPEAELARQTEPLRRPVVLPELGGVTRARFGVEGQIVHHVESEAVLAMNPRARSPSRVAGERLGDFVFLFLLVDLVLCLVVLANLASLGLGLLVEGLSSCSVCGRLLSVRQIRLSVFRLDRLHDRRRVPIALAGIVLRDRTPRDASASLCGPIRSRGEHQRQSEEQRLQRARARGAFVPVVLHCAEHTPPTPPEATLEVDGTAHLARCVMRPRCGPFFWLSSCSLAAMTTAPSPFGRSPSSSQ